MKYILFCMAFLLSCTSLSAQSLVNDQKIDSTFNRSEILKYWTIKSIPDISKRFTERFYFFPDLDVPTFNNTLKSLGSGALVVVPKAPIPVFYQHNIRVIFWGGTASGGLLLDEYDQVDPLEFVALPTDTLVIQEIFSDSGSLVARVSSPTYMASEGKEGLFIDLKGTLIYFVQTLDTKTLTASKQQVKITQSRLVKALENQEGSPYVWGGNVPKGIWALLRKYPPKTPISKEFQKKWTLTWVDCSGLLYAATNWFTPRNTQELAKYGSGVTISNLDKEKFFETLRPLDLIVWKSHVVVVLDNNRVIESAYADGKVMIKDLRTRAGEIFDTKIPVDQISDPVPEGKKGFVVRRWYGK